MIKFINVLAIVFCFSPNVFAKNQSIREVVIEGQDYTCRPLGTKVQCPISDLSTMMSFAANMSDAILCLNDLKGTPETFAQDQLIAKKCFKGLRLISLSNQISTLMVNKECTAQFNATCSESYKCNEYDTVFGGVRTHCGNLGRYLDFLQRVQGLPATVFTENDGKQICNELF